MAIEAIVTAAEDHTRYSAMTAPEQTRFPAAPANTAKPTVPTAGRAPGGRPAAGYVGTLIAVLMLGLGVIALR